MKASLLIFILFLNGVLISQKVEPFTPGIEYTMKDGLPSNHIYMVIQDEKGYYWIATDNGISKFDGYEFKNYSVKDGLPTNDIYELQEDKWGRIWLLNDTNKPTYLRGDSIKSFDVDIDGFNNYFVFEGVSEVLFSGLINNDHSNSVVIDYTDCYEILKSFNLYEKFPILKSITDSLNKNPAHVFPFYKSCSQNVMFSSLGLEDRLAGFYNDDIFFLKLKNQYPGFILNRNEYKFFYLNYNFDNFNQPYTITRKPLEKRYQIRVGNNMVLLDSNLCSTLFYSYDFNYKQYINRIYIDGINCNWLSTVKGLYVVNDWKRLNNLVVFDFETNILQFDEIESCLYFIDTKKNVTLNELSSNLYTKQTKLASIGKIEINDLLLEQKKLYILQKGQGVSIKDKNTFESNVFQWYKRPKQGLSINFGSNPKKIIPNLGNWSILYDGISVYIINDKSKRIIFLSHVHIYSMFKEKENAYLNTELGIDIYKHKDSIYFDHRIEIENIEKIIPFKEDHFLAFSIKGESFICDEFNCEKLNGLNGKVIETGFVSQDTAWLIYNDQIIKSYIDVNNIENSTYEELLPNGVLGEHVVLTDIVVSDSSIYLASNEGLFSMNRKLTKPEEIAIPFEFKSIKSPDSTYQISENAQIPYDQNSVTLEYTTIYYTSLGIEYHYQLFPIDDELQTSVSRSVRYADLKAGEYTFLIYATDQNGNRTEQNQIKFTIETPWWQSLLFKVLVGLLILLMIYLIYRRQINKIRKEQAKQIVINKRFAELELNALQSQMNPHFVFNTLNTLQNLVQREKLEDADYYIVKFSRLMRMFLESSKQKYIPLTDELKIIELYIELEKIRYKNKFDFSIDNHLTKDDLNTFVPSTILQPIVENSINHGIFHKKGKGNITIRLTKATDWLKIEISDDGIGRKAANEIKKNNKFGYKSYAISNINDKIEVLRQIDDFQIEYRVIDHYNNDIATGTTTEIKIKLE